jgi:hypothetical protein
MQKLLEENQLPKRSDWSGVIPLHMIAPSACINRQGRVLESLALRFLVSGTAGHTEPEVG